MKKFRIVRSMKVGLTKFICGIPSKIFMIISAILIFGSLYISMYLSLIPEGSILGMIPAIIFYVIVFWMAMIRANHGIKDIINKN